MGKLIDLTGQIFGNWTVIELVPPKLGKTLWRCKCSCGTLREVKTSSLRSGVSKSCGCLRRDDLTGRVFGQLKAVSLYLRKTRGTKQFYSCSCECGKNRIVEAGNLRSGHTVSCGSCSKKKDITGKRYGRLVAVRFIEKKNRKSIWECKCDCGNVTTGSIAVLQNGHKLSCGCLLSKAEMEFRKFLQENNFNFKTQYSFSDCIYKRRLKFDFAIFDFERLVCLVELQGEQHFIPVTFKYGKTLSLHDIELLKIRDNIKKTYCLKHKIPLLCIGYLDFKSKENIFKNYMKSL